MALQPNLNEDNMVADDFIIKFFNENKRDAEQQSFIILPPQPAQLSMEHVII